MSEAWCSIVIMQNSKSKPQKLARGPKPLKAVPKQAGSPKQLASGPLRFVDLFAGLGGFHLALKSLGHNCVLACEIDDELAGLYKQNFGIEPFGDIRQMNPEDAPDHDILCAGFPCQPFSKAGEQLGFHCPQWGDLFDNVHRILEFKKPTLFILENVPNILKHSKGLTWSTIEWRLKELGYTVDHRVLSPHQFGIPQIRHRTFIVGSLNGLDDFTWPAGDDKAALSIRSVLDENPSDARQLTSDNIEYLEVWQEFLDRFPKSQELPSFPIWAMEFGANYPFTECTPSNLSKEELASFKGSFGVRLSGNSKKEIIGELPAYARSTRKQFPKWKIDFIQQNRDLYESNKKWIDKWLPKLSGFPASFQKFEWNCKGEERNLWQHIIQFRASGIRVKRATYAPALVAMTTSQVPIIPWEHRYMTVLECSRLQSIEKLKYLPEAKTSAYRALGNAVNAKVVSEIAGSLIGSNAGRQSIVSKIDVKPKKYPSNRAKAA